MRGTVLALTLLLVGCGGPPAFLAAAPTPTATPILATPTPSSYTLTGKVTAPWCFGGYEIVNANVSIRDEANNIAGAATTEYAGDPSFVAYERAKRADRINAAHDVLWDVLNANGTLERGERGWGQRMERDIATMKGAGFSATDRAVFGDDRARTMELMEPLVRRAVRPGELATRLLIQDLMEIMLRTGFEYDPVLWKWADAFVDKNERAERLSLVAVFGEKEANCHASFATTIKPAPFYQLKIGTHDGPTYSFEDLRQRNFTVALTLGQSP